MPDLADDGGDPGVACLADEPDCESTGAQAPSRDSSVSQATALGDQAAVPPQDSAGRDQPVHPQPCWHVPDQRGEDRPVGPVEPGPASSAAQHGDLVPQHEQLGILGGR